MTICKVKVANSKFEHMMNAEKETKARHGYILWMAVCFVGGVICTFIPWGKPDAFHGRGLPFAGVMWDRPKGYDVFVDFPDPLAVILNPLAFCLMGSILSGCVWLIRRMNRRKSSSNNTHDGIRQPADGSPKPLV